MRRWAATAGGAVLLAALLHPLFFVIYRLMIFNTVPRDEYGLYLLWLLGEPGGKLHESPYVYRVLSVLAAAPFYYLLPTISLTNIPANLAQPYLRATAAMAALSFAASIAAAAVAYRLAVDKGGLGRAEGVLAGGLMLVFCWYAGIYAIDAPAILLVVIGLYLADRPYVFAAFAVGSIAFNEKVALTLAIWLTVRCIFSAEDRKLLGKQWVGAVAAVLAYLAVVRVLRLPGNPYQLEPGGYPRVLADNVLAMFTTRGLLLNVVPVLVLLGLAAVSWRALPGTVARGLFRPADLLVILGLIGVALILTLQYQMGRIVIHAAPLYVVPIAQALGDWLNAAKLPSSRMIS
jgi:hypothetical protein